MKLFKLSSIFLAITLLLVACSSNSNEANSSDTQKDNTITNNSQVPEEVTIGYQVIPNGELIAKEKGLVEEAFPDTKINWVQFDSGRDVNTAIAAGNLDFGLAGSVPVTTGIATNLAYKVYYIHDIIGEAESLVVSAKSGVNTFADLVGKKIGVPFGSTAHFSLLKALENEKIDASTVQILDLQPQDILAAWQRGDIDGAYVWHPTLGKIINDGAKVLTTSEKLAEEGIVTADLGIVSNTFAEKYPEFVAKYKETLDQAVALYRENPDEVAKTLAGVLGVNEDEVLSQTKGLIFIDSKEQQAADYLGTTEKPGNLSNVLLSTGEFLVNQKIITSSPALENYQSAIFFNK